MNELQHKISRELSEFKKLKQRYCFEFADLKEINEILYCKGKPLTDNEGKTVPECDEWINVGYKIKSSTSKVLSNLFPYRFWFKGHELYSIEAFFQGLKFPDPDIQRLIFTYSGTDAYHVQRTSEYDWRKTGILYWQGAPVNRHAPEYADLVDELYISAIQNPLYRQALKNVNKYILHSIGNPDENETVFTRKEFETQINALSAFVKHIS